MTPHELDEAAARLEEIGLEEEQLRSKLQDQVEAFGFTPPRAEKSKRLEGALYQFTVTRGLTTEIKDVEVERIRQACPVALFDRLFRTVTKFKLAEGATLALATPGRSSQLAVDVQPGSRNQRDCPQTSDREGRGRMHYADASELVAEIVAHKHVCGPNCLCWRLRTVPEVEAALIRMGVKDQERKSSPSF